MLKESHTIMQGHSPPSPTLTFHTTTSPVPLFSMLRRRSGKCKMIIFNYYKNINNSPPFPPPPKKRLIFSIDRHEKQSFKDEERSKRRMISTAGGQPSRRHKEGEREIRPTPTSTTTIINNESTNFF